MLIDTLLYDESILPGRRIQFDEILYFAGGTQLKSFSSVGKQPYGYADGLVVNQGSNVSVTVVAENAAGLQSVTYSDVITVDLSPPELCCLQVYPSHPQLYIVLYVNIKNKE